METEIEMPRIPLVDLAAQHAAIAEPIAEANARVLARTDWILGADVTCFEREFAEFCEVEHAVGVDSGTSALELALRAHGIGEGDEVITAANTFVATALAISYTGATPVLVDVDPERYTLDPHLLERAITRRTRAVVPVHLYGQPADMEPIVGIAREHELVVVEDACQAHGARYRGRRVGTLGDAAAFSFYPAKNLGAYGDGGIVVTGDAEADDAMRMLRNYGQREKYHHEIVGYNRRLDTLQAAMLRVKLERLEGWNEARRRHAELYTRLLAGAGVVTPTVADDVEHVWHLYVIRVPDREGLRAFLDERGIDTGIHYPVPVHHQRAYRHLGYSPTSFPVTERYADEIVSLPLYPELTVDAIERVADAVHAFSRQRRVPTRFRRATVASAASEPVGAGTGAAARDESAPRTPER